MMGLEYFLFLVVIVWIVKMRYFVWKAVILVVVRSFEVDIDNPEKIIDIFVFSPFRSYQHLLILRPEEVCISYTVFARCRHISEIKSLIIDSR